MMMTRPAISERAVLGRRFDSLTPLRKLSSLPECTACPKRKITRIDFLFLLHHETKQAALSLRVYFARGDKRWTVLAPHRTPSSKYNDGRADFRTVSVLRCHLQYLRLNTVICPHRHLQAIRLHSSIHP